MSGVGRVCGVVKVAGGGVVENNTYLIQFP